MLRNSFQDENKNLAQSNPTIIILFQVQSCVFILALSSLTMSKISTLHAWFEGSLLASSQSTHVPKSHEA